MTWSEHQWYWQQARTPCMCLSIVAVMVLHVASGDDVKV
jgi:hypothetical protein